MKDRLRTLYLEANGVGSTIIKVDTVLRGIFGYDNGAVPPKALRRYPKVNLLFGELADFNARLSYVADWRDAFIAAPRLDVEICNINNLVHYARCLLAVRQYDLIVVSHTAAGDDMTVLNKSAMAFQRRRCPLIAFFGNEYDLLDDKIGFAQKVGAEFVCSQLPVAAAEYLYAECRGARIVEMPHALNPRSYYPLPDNERPIDLGFVGDFYWPFVGDRERTEMIEWFEANASAIGLTCDIRRQRLSRDDWNLFLNDCNAVIGAESGTYYLNDRGRLLDRARAYNLHENPQAGFEHVFDRFYRDVPREVSGKSISSRHFEPIGAKTCQILLEGNYNGILKPNVHYIEVKKDLSNISDAIAQYRDESYRTRIVDQAFEYVTSQHTYRHRVEQLLDIVLASAEKKPPLGKVNGSLIGRTLTGVARATLKGKAKLGVIRRGTNLANGNDMDIPCDQLYRMLFDAAHDNDKAAPFAAQRTVAAFGHQWAEIPSGKFMLSDPIFKQEVDQIITRQEVLIDPAWFPGKRVLDAGCGGGRWSYGFGKLGAQLTAADTNPSAIAATRAALTELGAPADFVLTDLETIDTKLPPDSYDLVWCWGVLHHCTSFTQSLRALSRLVRPGGLIHLYLYGRQSIPIDADVELFKERLRYNFAPDDAAREAFLTQKMAGHGLDRHHVHDIYAPIINRRFYFEEVGAMLNGLGFKALPSPIEHSEVWITAVKGDDSDVTAYRLPKHPPPYWFQRP